jgi:hypothetical protein
LTTQEQTVLKRWLSQHPQYRFGTDKDCDCPEDIEQMKTGYGGLRKLVRDYHPYIAIGNFNGHGVEDFAVVVVDRSKKEKNFALVVFNGPFKSASASPAFMESGLDPAAAFCSQALTLLGFLLLLNSVGMARSQWQVRFRRSRGRRLLNVTSRSTCR